jgi:hypothetical protein
VRRVIYLLFLMSLLNAAPAGASGKLLPPPLLPRQWHAPSAEPSRRTSTRVAPDVAAGSLQWLNEINKYRGAGGAGAVTDESAWEPGIDNHLTYLEATPSQYFTGPYTSLHTENPESPYYTESGATEAGYSNLTEGGGGSEIDAIDAWWTAPFHAIGMLRPQLSRVAFGDHPSSGYAGLDVIQGLDPSSPKPSEPVLFPGPGVTTNLTQFNGGELPTPLETCGWQSLGTVGLPIVVLLPAPPDQGLTASIAGPGGQTESSENGEVCVVDEHDYFSSDPTYGEDGREILEGENAVLVIPRNPLTNGSYEVLLQQPAQGDVEWGFSVVRPETGTPNEPGSPEGLPGANDDEVGTDTTSSHTGSYSGGTVFSPGVSPGPSPGNFYLTITFRHGRAMLHFPSWAPRGLEFKSYAYKQVRHCGQRGRNCRWSTVSVASRLYRTAGAATNFPLPYRVSPGRRVKVTITDLPFSVAGWEYSATTTTAIEH